MNLDLEFQKYVASAYGETLEAGSVQWIELRRAFFAGIHLAACHCRPHPPAVRLSKITMQFAQNIGDRRN